MNASFITHGLKTLGGGTKMWVGVLVIAAVAASAAVWLNDPKNRQHLQDGLFG